MSKKIIKIHEIEIIKPKIDKFLWSLLWVACKKRFRFIFELVFELHAKPECNRNYLPKFTTRKVRKIKIHFFEKSKLNSIILNTNQIELLKDIIHFCIKI